MASPGFNSNQNLNSIQYDMGPLSDAPGYYSKPVPHYEVLASNRKVIRKSNIGYPR